MLFFHLKRIACPETLPHKKSQRKLAFSYSSRFLCQSLHLVLYSERNRSLSSTLICLHFSRIAYLRSANFFPPPFPKLPNSNLHKTRRPSACQKFKRPTWATSGRIEFHKNLMAKPKQVAPKMATGIKKRNFLPRLKFPRLIIQS